MQVSMLFSQIIPPSPSPTESKRPFYTSVSLLLSHIQGYHSVQFSHSVMSDSLQPHESQHTRPVHHQLPEFTQTHIHRVSDAIQPSHPRSSPSPPAPNPSQHQSLFNESTLHMRCPKYWSFSFSIIPSKEYSELISFKIDWFDLLAVQGTLKSLQHHSSKASIL